MENRSRTRQVGGRGRPAAGRVPGAAEAGERPGPADHREGGTGRRGVQPEAPGGGGAEAERALHESEGRDRGRAGEGAERHPRRSGRRSAVMAATQGDRPRDQQEDHEALIRDFVSKSGRAQLREAQAGSPLRRSPGRTGLRSTTSSTRSKRKWRWSVETLTSEPGCCGCSRSQNVNAEAKDQTDPGAFRQNALPVSR